MTWFFLFFLVSGFCSILYELVWMRLGMAAFGVTTALTSIVLSVFMAGLGLGSWAAGRWTRWGRGWRVPTLVVYAGLEAVIGASALLVPRELLWGRVLTEHLGMSSSFLFYLFSGVCVAAAMLPWCAAMGATIPVGMLAIEEARGAESKRAFSYLYMSNVTGAVVGTVVPLFLIELLGFHGTLRVGAALNFALALTAGTLGWIWGNRTQKAKEEVEAVAEASGSRSWVSAGRGGDGLLVLLFLTGLTSMAMEVVWIRQFTPYAGNLVYAFAAILGCYLWATSAGAAVYRRWMVGHAGIGAWVWALLGVSALLPVITANPGVGGIRMQEVNWASFGRLATGIVPFSALLGFVTPMLVDRWSGGDAERVGKAYAVNIVGCILGPLVSGFGLLPFLAERWVLFLMALPWLAVGVKTATKARERSWLGRGWAYAAVGVAVVVVGTNHGYENAFPVRRVLRDHTATVVAAEVNGEKELLVNGSGMTTLTPITKMMAHLPMAFLERPPKNALVICFGMGTTFRSMLSWGVPVTAVELVPSVPRMVGFFHADGAEVLASAQGRVVIDDGRRFLERTEEQYDVIAIDPPPPVEAAGSSLLYSKEFYQTIRKRLRVGGILQQWIPVTGDPMVQAGVTRALVESFPYVRAFSSVEGWGTHFLASDQPLSRASCGELVGRMPAAAVRDMVEWGPHRDPVAQCAASVEREIPLSTLMAVDEAAPALVDDHPLNEYFLLRRNGW
jgi:predicted membrane-bound spermidine synthase